MTSHSFNQFSAQASMLGYIYQVKYALLMALQAYLESDGNMGITIERTDDVAVTQDGQLSEVVQTKYHLSPGRITDSSADFWKTLRIWSDGCLSGEIAIPGTLLTLITTETAADGSVAFFLRPNSKYRDEKTALDILNNIASSSKSTELETSFKSFSNLSDKQKAELVACIRILDESPKIDDLNSRIEQLIKPSCIRKHRLSFREHLEGWWIEKVLSHLQVNASHIISISEIEHMIDHLRDKYRKDNLPSYDINIESDKLYSDHDRHVFLQQLKLIGYKEKSLRVRIEDYFIASATRSRWIRENVLYQKELDDYDKNLIREWDRHFSDMVGDPDIEYADDTSKSRLARELFKKIEGQTILIRTDFTNSALMKGSYHLLADVGIVGWHAEYADRLKDEIARRTKK